MFVLYAEKNQLIVREKEPITSGSVNVYPVQFEFSDDWDGLAKTAVFQAGCAEKTVALTGGACTIPAEVLCAAGYFLVAGVCGRRGDTVVLLTVWVSLGLIQEGAMSGGGVPEPSPLPEDWRDALNGKGDTLGYTESGDLGLYPGEKLLSSVSVEAGSGGGTTDHRRLTHRDAAEQHPVQAISGLAEELERIPKPVEALTNTELEALLK